MPRGRGKGGNKRKKGKNIQQGEKRDLVYKEDGQEYGQIMRLLGNGRVEVNCFDGMKRICTIRGRMRNRVWINAGDIILVSLREFGDEKADVIHKYYPEEAYELQDLGEIPENIAINEGVPDEGEGMEMGGEVDENGEENKADDIDIDDL